MLTLVKPTVLSGLILLAAAVPALADPFTLDPQAVKLNGSRFTADRFVLSDYAHITFAFPVFGATSLTQEFTDVGFLPVLGFKLNGQAVSVPGFAPPANAQGAGGASGGWGAYISYAGKGIQTVSYSTGQMSAGYSELTYQLVGYNGVATFGFDANDDATVSNPPGGVTTLATGSLIPGVPEAGTLAFTPVPDKQPTISGRAVESLDEAKAQFIVGKPAALDVTFVHPGEEYGMTPFPGTQFPMSLKITGGSSSYATLILSNNESANASVDLPEPASAGLLALGIAGLGWLRTRRPATRG